MFATLTAVSLAVLTAVLVGVVFHATPAAAPSGRHAVGRPGTVHYRPTRAPQVRRSGNLYSVATVLSFVTSRDADPFPISPSGVTA